MKVFLLLVLCSSPLYAAGRYVEWGVGEFNTTQTEYSQVKFAEIGKKGAINGTFDYSNGVGGFVDSSSYVGSSSSGYGVLQAGLGPHLQNFVLSYYFGGAYILTPDSILGSHFQFAHEMIIGVKDVRGVMLFMSIKHFSNAGLVKPNVGRTFMGVGVAF